jgi:hypothetical protein
MNLDRRQELQRRIAAADEALRIIQSIEMDLRAKPDAYDSKRMNALLEANANATAATQTMITAWQCELEQLDRPSSN